MVLKTKEKLILSNYFEDKYSESLLKYVNRLFDKMNIDIEKDFINYKRWLFG